MVAAPNNAIVPVEVKDAIERIQIQKEIVRQLLDTELVEGTDYGVIPGTGTKPTLYLAGAEKVMRGLHAVPQFTEVYVMRDYDKPLFHYEYQCRLIDADTSQPIPGGVGLGLCTSMESSFRWRDAKRKCPNCGQTTIIKGKAEYGGGWLCFKKSGGCGAKFADGDQVIEGQLIGRIENPDIFDQVNAICKRGKKRALVDAVKGAAGMSDRMTADLEDNPRAFSSDSNVVDGDYEDVTEAQQKQQQKALGPADWVKPAGALQKAIDWACKSFGIQPADVLEAAQVMYPTVTDLKAFPGSQAKFMACMIAYGNGYDDRKIETYTSNMPGKDDDKFLNYNNALDVAKLWRLQHPDPETNEAAAESGDDIADADPLADTGGNWNDPAPAEGKPLIARIFERVAHLYDEADDTAKAAHNLNVFKKLIPAGSITQAMIDAEDVDAIVNAITEDRKKRSFNDIGPVTTGNPNPPRSRQPAANK